MTFVRIWRYRVQPGRAAEFERAYAADGDWAKLFSHGEGYLGTELLRPVPPGVEHVTIDRWRDEADWVRFLDDRADEYHRLDARLEVLCREEREVGSFVTHPDRVGA